MWKADANPKFTNFVFVAKITTSALSEEDEETKPVKIIDLLLLIKLSFLIFEYLVYVYIIHIHYTLYIYIYIYIYI